MTCRLLCSAPCQVVPCQYLNELPLGEVDHRVPPFSGAWPEEHDRESMRSLLRNDGRREIEACQRVHRPSPEEGFDLRIVGRKGLGLFSLLLAQLEWRDGMLNRHHLVRRRVDERDHRAVLLIVVETDD